jgi:hypothetical protein
VQRTRLLTMDQPVDIINASEATLTFRVSPCRKLIPPPYSYALWKCLAHIRVRESVEVTSREACRKVAR